MEKVDYYCIIPDRSRLRVAYMRNRNIVLIFEVNSQFTVEMYLLHVMLSNAVKVVQDN